MSDAKANAAIRAEEQELFNKVSKEVEAILLANEVALQPFLSFSEFGVSPRIRLITIPKPKTNDNGANSEEVEGGESTDDTTETVTA